MPCRIFVLKFKATKKKAMFGKEKKKEKKKIMPANSVHHCLSGCCYIPSVNNFFWEGNKISWNWTLNLDFCHSYAWGPCTEPSRSLQTAGLVVALELAKSQLMPSYWQIRSSSWPDLAGLTPSDGVNHVCVSPLQAFEGISASSTIQQQAPFVWKFQRGGGAGFPAQPGWLSF